MMKTFTLMACLMAIGCATQPPQSEFIAHPHEIDQRLQSASIEEYILALPVYYSEGGDEYYKEQVLRAREAFPENQGKGRDYLFIEGSGCDGKQIISLDRETHTLTILMHLWEPWLDDSGEWKTSENLYAQIIMRRAPGGWIRTDGPDVHLPEPENHP